MSEQVRRDARWHIVMRWQEYEGEARANLLRLMALVAFYCIHLLNYYGLHLGGLSISPGAGLDRRFHIAATALACCWAAIGVAVHYALQKRFFPSYLKTLSTAGDILVLTLMLLIADGPRSPLVSVYFLIVVLAGLRFSIPLVWFATGGCLASYLIIIANAFWFRPQFRVARYHEAIVGLSMLVLGVLIGQILRAVRRMAADYAMRVPAFGETKP